MLGICYPLVDSIPRIQTRTGYHAWQTPPGARTAEAIESSARQRDQALRQGIPFGTDLKFAKDTEFLRLIVFDRGSSAVGSLTIPVAAAR